ncbi:unnamed protein product, partial [Acidithrix sp. C25]
VAQDKITREDIKAKFEELESGLTKAGKTALPALPAIGTAIGVGVFVVALYLGYRLGRKRNTIVEITRI